MRLYKAHWEHLFTDIILLAMAFYLAYLVRFDASIPRIEADQLVRIIPFVVLGHLLLNYVVGVYQHLWRYTALSDLLDIAKGAFFTVLAFFLFDRFIYQSQSHIVPYGVIVIYFFLSIFLLFGARLFRKWLAKSERRGFAGRKTLILGAGDAGQALVEELKRNPRSKNLPVAYLDDDEKKVGKKILGLPVKGKIRDLARVAEENGIEEVIIAIPSAARGRISEIIGLCTRLGVQSKIVPGYQEIIESSTLSLNKIRDVDIEDLLGREPARLDMQSISSYLRDSVVLVTGAGGSIGSELCRQILRFQPKQLILLGHGENSIYQIDLELKDLKDGCEVLPLIADVKDKFKIDRIFAFYKPGIVFHAAAHKHVPLMESNPEEAVLNNIIGTQNVAGAAERYGARSFVLVSTDKAVNPTNVMGATKRGAEMVIQDLAKSSGTKFSAVRFGNVLGSRGSVIPLFKRQIEMGGPITITHSEATRYFMTIPEASQLILQSGALARGGEIFILDMGEPVKIVDMAKELLRLSGLDESEIEIKFIGLRPGEKIKEELLTAEEGTTTTRIEKVFVAKPNSLDPHFATKIKNLKTAAESGEKEKILALLKNLVLGYRQEGSL